MNGYEVHDPARGYYASSQFMMLTFFAGLVAYLRFVRGRSRWWYVGALLLVVVLLESYEANYPLVLLGAVQNGHEAGLSRRSRW